VHPQETLPSNRHFCFGNEHFQNGRLTIYNFQTDGLYVKLDCRFHIGQGFFVCLAFSYNNTLQSKRIGFIALRMFLNDNLELFDHRYLLFFADKSTIEQMPADAKDDDATSGVSPTSGIP